LLLVKNWIHKQVDKLNISDKKRMKYIIIMFLSLSGKPLYNHFRILNSSVTKINKIQILKRDPNLAGKKFKLKDFFLLILVSKLTNTDTNLAISIT